MVFIVKHISIIYDNVILFLTINHFVFLISHLNYHFGTLNSNI